MLLAALVVSVARAAHRLDDCLLADVARALLIWLGRLDRGFERGEGNARIPARRMSNARKHFVGDVWAQGGETALFIGERASQQCRYVILAKRFKREDAAAREKRADDLEGGVLGSRA